MVKYICDIDILCDIILYLNSNIFHLCCKLELSLDSDKCP